jgi:ADP-L-glycero-D-manno-heptose 6-epimerase
MYIVTGGAGFIGSNILKGLNERGISDILVVDNLTRGQKSRNLAELNFVDYMDKDEFITNFLEKKINKKIDAVFHYGGCSNTTETNGRYLMDVNYSYSKKVLHQCIENKIPFFYASSAAVYGNSLVFKEDPIYEKPITMYGFSKLQFDRYVRSLGKIESQVVGFRYFNVYGPREKHKEKKASVMLHFRTLINKDESIKLYGAYDGYNAGEQKRDYIYIDDVVSVNLWCLDHPEVSGIFNVGTGEAKSFNQVAKAIIAFYNHGQITYIPFPDDLKKAYQSFTQADTSLLRASGYTKPFIPIEAGISDYIKWLES